MEPELQKKQSEQPPRTGRPIQIMWRMGNTRRAGEFGSGFHQEFKSAQEHADAAMRTFKKYQRLLKFFPLIFVGLNIAVFYFLYAVAKINVPIFILVFVLMIFLLKELSTLIFSFQMRKNLMRPLETLKEAVNQISEGHYGYTIEGYHPNMVADLMDSFNQMSLELKESHDLKLRYENNRKELIAGISHDLKTPITSILGYLEGIREGVADNPEKLKTYMDIIYGNARYTNRLIDDLFLFSKLEINQLVFHFETVQIGHYFTDIFEEKKLELEESGATVTYSNELTSVQNDMMLSLDSKMIYRVVSNLITNAIKYNDKNQLQISMALKCLSEDPKEVLVEISDNGQGIVQEQLDQIFDSFYRADATRNKDIGGTGLGLSIAKRLVEAHGGRIWATSEVGIGTTFCFTLKDINRP